MPRVSGPDLFHPAGHTKSQPSYYCVLSGTEKFPGATWFMDTRSMRQLLDHHGIGSVHLLVLYTYYRVHMNRGAIVRHHHHILLCIFGTMTDTRSPSGFSVVLEVYLYITKRPNAAINNAGSKTRAEREAPVEIGVGANPPGTNRPSIMYIGLAILRHKMDNVPLITFTYRLIIL